MKLIFFFSTKLTIRLVSAVDKYINKSSSCFYLRPNLVKGIMSLTGCMLHAFVQF